MTPKDSGRPGAGLPPAAPLAMVETAFLASTASLLWIASFYLGLTPFLRLFFPLPLALAYLRWGRRAGWMTLVTTTLLLAVLMGPPRGLVYICRYGFLGVALGYFWRSGRGWGLTVAVGTVLSTLGFFAQIALLSLLSGEDLWVYVVNQVSQLLANLLDFFGILAQPQPLWINVGMLATVAGFSVLYVAVVQMVAWVLLERLGPHPMAAPPAWVQVILGLE